MDNEYVADPRKSTLSQALRNILSPSETARKKAEELLKALEVVEKFGIYLVESIIEQTERIEIRLLSVVILKQYVEIHWCKSAEKFRKPEISRTSKEYIKSMLPTTFSDSATNLRNNVARVISTIAHFEYPNEWPTFFDVMIDSVKNGDNMKSQGAMQCLLDYLSIPNTTMKPTFIADLLGHMLEIVSNSNHQYSVRTRSQSVKMFKMAVHVMKKLIVKSPKCKANFEGIIQSFLHIFVEVLITADNSIPTYELKNNIIKTIEEILIEFPHVAQSYLHQILPIIWELLVKSSNEYQKQTVVNQEFYDDEGEIINIDTQIITIFELVRALCISGRDISGSIHNVLVDLFFHTIVCMQITPAIMTVWNKNCDHFVSDETEDNSDYKVRQAANNLINDILNILDANVTVSAFCEALCRHICHAEAKRDANLPDWWQGLEASMYALGSVRRKIIVEYNRDKLSDFNLLGYLNTAAQYTQENDIHMLLGRCIWLCAMFCDIMERSMLEIVVESTIKHLQYSTSVFVRIYALRALKNYCNLTMVSGNQSLLEHHAPGILNCLCNIVNVFGVNILRLTLEAMTMFVKVNTNFTAGSIELIVPFAISIFLRHNDDPTITALMMQLIRALVRIPNVLPQLQGIFAPTLLGVLNSPVSVATSGVHIVALETLGTIVKYQREPLNERFLETLFPATINVILSSSDFHVLQAGGECLSNFLFSDAAQQVCTYRNAEGQLGIDFIIQIINKLLDPYGHEYNAKFIGQLIITLIIKAGEHVFTRLEPLLRAILSKMQCTESDRNMQCLISIFAYLIHTQIDAVINFLSTIPGPNGEAALEFVLMEWVYTHPSIDTEFEHKIGVIALIQLLEYGITNDNYIIRTMAVNDSPELDLDEMQCQWLPILAKILKVLIHSMNKCDPTADTTVSRDTSNQTCPTDMESIFLMDDNNESNSGAEEDTSVMSLLPPLQHLNTTDHICTFLLTIKNNDVFRSFFRYCSEQECNMLSQIGIEVSRYMLPCCT